MMKKMTKKAQKAHLKNPQEQQMEQILEYQIILN